MKFFSDIRLLLLVDRYFAHRVGEGQPALAVDRAVFAAGGGGRVCGRAVCHWVLALVRSIADGQADRRGRSGRSAANTI